MSKQQSIFKKRSILLGILVLVLGIAVYLNWYLSQNQATSVTDVLNNNTMGEALYVNADATQKQEENYFTKARENRKKARDEALQTLKEIIENVKSEPTAVADATEKSVAIAKNIETESNIEELIKAKGFQECVTIIGDLDVTVIVQTEGLLADQTVQIQEIARQESRFSLQNIKIIEVK